MSSNLVSHLTLKPYLGIIPNLKQPEENPKQLDWLPQENNE